MHINEQRGTLQPILAHGQITTLFQPILSLSERAVFGHEALSRGPSNSPLHSPITLFAAARSGGWLNELELACRRSACEAFRSRGFAGKLFLNISPDSLLQPDHRPGCTLELLETYQISPASVVIELTEQTPTDDFVLLDRALHHYRQMGFSIALDDLGAGYSSLRLWSELRPDYVKIDRYFIDGIHHDPVKREFVESILKIAWTSRAQVIAEGIEQAQELAMLRNMGVDLVQGYLLGRPQEQPSVGQGALPAAATCVQDRSADQAVRVFVDQPIAEVFRLFRKDPGLETVVVVDDCQRALGTLPRPA